MPRLRNRTDAPGAGDAQDPLRLDRQVCFPLYAASNLLTRLYRPALADIGLTYPQYLVMLVLWEAEPQSVGALGERLHLDSGTLTPLLKRMADADLVTRRRDATDERRVLIELTPSGRALRARARQVPLTLAAALDLSPEALDTLRETVQTLVTVLAQEPAHDRAASPGRRG
ncbi:MarR family winged helix-turn-helix transcriptional regulator [Xanthomonas hortorum]|uniref:MarR family winged helix-turn-helix transcriptional regulator n=1 Tax=Xanthomonas hortorum TaxID=56454 RepID=UPI002359D587|nr:MarR family transcriptional regulator [Xanthomonas hortorum]